uniref:G_PROTEIN_RECEP_F1_2 domain-containing protein n=1 Tax=Parastrongyloides trichosuri TaxID=131310 RepID=A0A0N4ZKR1_PARTI
MNGTSKDWGDKFLNETQPIEFPNIMTKPFSRYQIHSWGLIFAVICDILGIIGLFLNFFVVYALLVNRKRMLSNIFYVLVLHCSIVDIVRGISLIINGIPNILTSLGLTIIAIPNLLTITQYISILLRSCNLLTIFNLLIFTTNEFIVIKFPLHYRRYFSRKTVIFLIGLGWVISILFGVGYVALNTLFETKSIMIQTQISNDSLYNREDSYIESDYGLYDSIEEYDNNGTIDWKDWLNMSTSTIMKRPEGSSMNPVTISSFIIFILCYICLFIVLICYGIILRRIRRFHSSSSFKSNNFHESKKNINKVQLNKRVSQNSCIHTHNPSTTSSIRGKSCSSPIKASFRRGNSYKKWKSHIMSRHKYLIVIGSVLFVDILFLIPYSAIQMISILYITNKLGNSAIGLSFRCGLQLMIGIHSVCQPMCYFRMTEFRQMACFKKSSKMNSDHSKNELGRVKSVSAAGPKTFHHTKSNWNNQEVIEKTLNEQNKILQKNTFEIYNEIEDNDLTESSTSLKKNNDNKNLSYLIADSFIKKQNNSVFRKQLSFNRPNYPNLNQKRLSLFSKLINDNEIQVVGMAFKSENNNVNSFHLKSKMDSNKSIEKKIIA